MQLPLHPPAQKPQTQEDEKLRSEKELTQKDISELSSFSLGQLPIPLSLVERFKLLLALPELKHIFSKAVFSMLT
jgi:hypothetical protein